MLPSDIILDTNTYALRTQRLNSSVRADVNRDLAKPVTLTISHETAKSGRVSSVVIFDSAEVIDCDASCNLTPTTDNIRMQVKLQYNPLSGRVATEAEIERLYEQVQLFLTDNALWVRFLNQES